MATLCQDKQTNELSLSLYRYYTYMVNAIADPVTKDFGYEGLYLKKTNAWCLLVTPNKLAITVALRHHVQQLASTCHEATQNFPPLCLKRKYVNTTTPSSTVLPLFTHLFHLPSYILFITIQVCLLLYGLVVVFNMKMIFVQS